jgi:hypothetical protein
MNEFTNLLESTSKVNEKEEFDSAFSDLPEEKVVSQAVEMVSDWWNSATNREGKVVSVLSSALKYTTKEKLIKGFAVAISQEHPWPTALLRIVGSVLNCRVSDFVTESTMKIKEGNQDKVDSILDKLDIPVEEFDDSFKVLLSQPFTQTNVSKALESLQKIKVILDELKSVKEGKVPDYRKDKEETVIKKLTEDLDKQDYVIVGAYDWKEVDKLLDGLKKALHKIGVGMYSLSFLRGSDNYGFIVSKKLLSPKEVAAIEKENRPGR